MKSFLLWALAILLVVTMQGSLSYFMSISGVRPDLAMVFVVLSGICYGSSRGLVVGFFCGLMLDLLNTGMFGFYTFSFMLVGIVSGMVQKKVFEDNYFLPLLMVGLISIVIELLWYSCLWLSGYNLTGFSWIFAAAGGKVVYNIFLTLPMLFLFNKVGRTVA